MTGGFSIESATARVQDATSRKSTDLTRLASSARQLSCLGSQFDPAEFPNFRDTVCQEDE